MAERPPRKLADLHAIPLGDFVKARDALAAELRQTGHAAEAADVKKLRKPTPVVWAVNRVLRRLATVA